MPDVAIYLYHWSVHTAPADDLYYLSGFLISNLRPKHQYFNRLKGLSQGKYENSKINVQRIYRISTNRLLKIALLWINVSKNLASLNKLSNFLLLVYTIYFHSVEIIP